MSDSQAALRVLTVLRCLRRKWCSVAQLVELAGRDEKTIRRDLQVIRQAGFRLRVKVEKHGRKKWRLSDFRAAEH